MRDTLTGSGYGRVVGLRGTPDSLRAANDVLPWWWTLSSSTPDHVLEISSPAAAPLVVRDLEHWVAEHAVDRVFVHGACIAVGDQALVLPGRSYAGKTSLCAELLRRGARYLSDEYAVLDRDGLVHPYPRPLQIRENHLRRAVTPESLGSTTAKGPLAVGGVAVLHFDSRSEWKASSITPAATILHVLDNVVCARSRPKEALDAVGAAVDKSVFRVAGVRGEADEAAARLDDLVRQAW